MAQKPLFKRGKDNNKKKKLAVSKKPPKQRKGKFVKAPNKITAVMKMEMEATVQINKKNEGNSAVAAASQGGGLAVVRADEDRVAEARKNAFKLPKKKVGVAFFKRPKPELVSAHM